MHGALREYWLMRGQFRGRTTWSVQWKLVLRNAYLSMDPDSGSHPDGGRLLPKGAHLGGIVWV